MRALRIAAIGVVVSPLLAIVGIGIYCAVTAGGWFGTMAVLYALLWLSAYIYLGGNG